MLKRRLLWWLVLFSVVTVLAYTASLLVPRPPAEEELFRQIVPGMTEAEVKKTLGRPADLSCSLPQDVKCPPTQKVQVMRIWRGKKHDLCLISVQGILTQSSSEELCEEEVRRRNPPWWEKWLPPGW